MFPGGDGTTAVHEMPPVAIDVQACVRAVKFITYEGSFTAGVVPFICRSETTSDCGVVTPAAGGSTENVNDAALVTRSIELDRVLDGPPGAFAHRFPPDEVKDPWQPLSSRVRKAGTAAGRSR